MNVAPLRFDFWQSAANPDTPELTEVDMWKLHNLTEKWCVRRDDRVAANVKAMKEFYANPVSIKMIDIVWYASVNRTIISAL